MACWLHVTCTVIIFGAYMCGAQSPTAVLDGTIQAYAVSWADVSTATAKSLTGTCLCDITHSVCDTNCCCDQDCGSAAVAAFTSAQSCLYEGQKLGELDYCIPKSEVSKVNIPSSTGFFTVTKKDAEQDFMSQLLCVVSDRNPNLGAKYQDPVAKDTDTSKLQSACAASKQAGSSSSSASYRLQGALQTQFSYAAETSSGTFTLPVPAFSSACEDVQRVGFMAPLPSTPEELFSSCSRPIRTLQHLQELCSSTPSTSAARFASAAYATSPSDTTFPVPTTLVSLQVMDPDTGALAPLPTSSTPPAPSFDAATSTCTNLVRQAVFTFVYNPSGTLQASSPVQLALVLTNATLPAAGSPDPLFQQRVKVTWVPASLAGSPPEAFSGNPGYIPNYPVLAGTLATDPQVETTVAVQRYFEGFPVPVAGAGGLCDRRASMPLRYGTNATSSCHLRLTEPQLAAWCRQGAASAGAALLGGVYDDLVAAKVVLGVWGNSAHTDVSQWIKIAASAPSVEPSWDVQTSTCTNIPTGVDIRLLTAMADAAAAPKLKLLAAAGCFSAGTWRFTAADTTQAQTFVVQHSVTFSALQQDPARMARRHVPPLSPNLPGDLLYPFLD